MEKASSRAIYAAIAANPVIAASKFVAATFTDSAAMDRQSLHSVVVAAVQPRDPNAAA